MTPTISIAPDRPLTWQDVIEHPALKDLPFKIELNKRGQLIMTPASNLHGNRQAKFARLIYKYMGGETITECSISTPEGVKVADVAWLSEEFLEAHGMETPYRKAPELCVEIVSPANTDAEMEEKTMLYLAKGAKEVWLCDLEGSVRFFGYEGEMKSSALAPDFPTKI